MSYSSTRVWRSEQQKRKEADEALLSRFDHMLDKRDEVCPDSPFFHKKLTMMDQWKLMAKAMCKLKELRLRAGIADIEARRLQPDPKLVKLDPPKPFQGKIFSGPNRGPVLHIPTIFCIQYPTSDEFISPWPSQQELFFEGPDRISTGLANQRCLPLPRADDAHETDKSKVKAKKPHYFDDFCRPPTLEDIMHFHYKFAESEFSDDEGAAAIGYDLMSRLDPDYIWSEDDCPPIPDPSKTSGTAKTPSVQLAVRTMPPVGPRASWSERGKYSNKRNYINCSFELDDDARAALENLKIPKRASRVDSPMRANRPANGNRASKTDEAIKGNKTDKVDIAIKGNFTTMIDDAKKKVYNATMVDYAKDFHKANNFDNAKNVNNAKQAGKAKLIIPIKPVEAVQIKNFVFKLEPSPAKQFERKIDKAARLADRRMKKVREAEKTAKLAEEFLVETETWPTLSSSSSDASTERVQEVDNGYGCTKSKWTDIFK